MKYLTSFLILLSSCKGYIGKDGPAKKTSAIDCRLHEYMIEIGNDTTAPITLGLLYYEEKAETHCYSRVGDDAASTPIEYGTAFIDGSVVGNCTVDLPKLNFFVNFNFELENAEATADISLLNDKEAAPVYRDLPLKCIATEL